MDILEFIPVGKRNAVSRRYLKDITHIPDRKLRNLIHQARRKIPILNLSDGRGYYIPDMNTEEDRQALVQYVRQEENRIKSTGWALYAARRTLRNCNIDWRNYEQQGKGEARRT